MPTYRFIGLIVALCTVSSFADSSIVTDHDASAPARHGMNALVEALKAKNVTVSFVDSLDKAGDEAIVAGLATGSGPAATMVKDETIPKAPESVIIRRVKMNQKRVLVLSGSDARGLMYAELDAADRVGWSEGNDDVLREIAQTTESPDCPQRAISMYTMQRAYFEQRLYDDKYWDRYFDLLAHDRFDSFVLIFGYENGGFLAPPYPYFFNVDGFPDVRMVGITPQ